MKMDLRRIEYFTEVAELLNYSRAAEKLHISHQALSKQIRLLEEEMGVQLLERSTTKVSLTAAGARVYQTFKPLLEELDRSYVRVTEYIQYQKGNLRIGYFNGISYSRNVVPLVAWLEERQPGLHINMLATDIVLIRQLLDQDSIDLAIFPMFDRQQWEGRVCRRIYHSPAKVIVSDRHPWYERETLDAQTLSGGSLLTYYSQTLSGENAFLPELKTASRIAAQNYDTYMGLLRRGEAFGIIGDTYSRREGSYKLFDLPAQYQSDANIVAVYKPNHPLKKLLDQLEAFSAG